MTNKLTETLLSNIEESINLKENFLKSNIDDVIYIGNILAEVLTTEVYEAAGKLLICGNGGSAADAQHFAAELTGRFKKNRKALPAISLTTDTSAITAIGNDYSFDEIFSRQVEATSNKNDILVVFSTSGNSKNIIKAVESANKSGLVTVGLLGNDGGKLQELCDYSITVPSSVTARIQEIHTMIYHFWCEIIDSKF